jgi:multiple sugar transport system substrate-binding protein
MRRPAIPAALALILTASIAGCGGGDAPSTAEAAKAHGPITIWYSNNPDEVAWGKQMVEAWNAEHADQKITAQEVPTGKSSEEVIGAAITAGNEPCLIFNTAPAAVPQFQKQGGLVPLDGFPDATSYIEQRSGKLAEQYRSPDGKYYQLPWKSNPVQIFYNKKMFAKAGLDPAKPQLASYDQFLATADQAMKRGGAKYAIWPAPTSEFFQSWFDYYPLFAAATNGQQLVEKEKSQFTSEAGVKVADFWAQVYARNLAGKETYQGDAFADGKAAMAIVGPWAIAVYKGKVDWGVAPVPTPTGVPADQVHTFSDAKNVAMYASCKNRGTAWDVLKFATSKEQDGKWLDRTGQMPLRTDLKSAYPDYFVKNPAYTSFADAATRTVEVPNVPNSVTIWQTFRDAYSKSVIFGKADVRSTFDEAAKKIDGLAKNS